VVAAAGRVGWSIVSGGALGIDGDAHRAGSFPDRGPWVYARVPHPPGGLRVKDKDRTGEEVAGEAGKLLIETGAFQRMFQDHGAVMYIVDLATFCIIDVNASALRFYGYDRATMLTKRIPDLNITPEPEIRAEIKRAVAEGRSHYVFQHRLANGEIRDVEVYANPILIQGKEYSFSVVHDITARRQAEEEREQLIAELKAALAEIKTLRGIIPICCFCKKIRDDQGYWTKVEDYVRARSDAEFTHSFCPDCSREHYPDYQDE
jgi:PAS domain S-box-containing protein